MKLNLQQFAGSLTVTIHKGSGITAATATPASGLSEGDSVALAFTPATGKKVDKVINLTTGATYPSNVSGFRMPASSVVLAVTSKDNNLYKVVENCSVNVNGRKIELTRNMTLEIGKTGVVIGVECEGAPIEMNEGIKNLIDQGILIKL